ncbi:MAG: copper amine oxidase N-terminal domain-containing protein [Candidatus Cybelea sp.]
MISTLPRALAAAVITTTLVVTTSPQAVFAQPVTVRLNGQTLFLNPAPIVREGRVFVPLRGIFEHMGASVVYSAGTINATKQNTTVQLRIGSTQATVNGQPQTLDVAPFIIGASTYVPLRFVAQAFGAVVGWEQATRVVTINMPTGGPVAPPPVRPPPPPVPAPSMVYLRAQQPTPGSRVASGFVTISAQFSHRVNPGSVRVWLDNSDVTSRSDISPTGFSHTSRAPLLIGNHTVRVAGRDAGGVGFERSWSFTVFGAPVPPGQSVQLRNQQPSPGSNVRDRFATISSEFTYNVDAGSLTIYLDGNNVTNRSATSSTRFSYKPPAPLDYGSHKVRVTGRSGGRGTFDRSWSFNVIRSGPAEIHLTISQPVPGGAVNRSFTIAGNTVSRGHVKVTIGSTPSYTGLFNGSTDAGPAGNFRIEVTLMAPPGLQAISLKITASDPASSQTTEKTMQVRVK